MANLLSSFLNGSSTFTYNNGTNVIPSYTLVQPTFSNTSTGASIFNQTFGSSSSFGNSLLFGSSLGGSTLTGSFGNSFNVSGFNSSFNYGSLGNGFGFGTIARTSTTTTTTTSGNVLTTVDATEETSFPFNSTDFEYPDGSAIGGIYIVSLPSNGTISLSNSSNDIDVGDTIDASDLANLRYTGDTDFDQTDSFAIRLSADGETFDTTNYSISIDVEGTNDAQEIEGTSTLSVAEGGTLTSLGTTIVDSIVDPDTDDTIDEVKVYTSAAKVYGRIWYTSDAGNEIEITDDDELISQSEAASLYFMANTDAVIAKSGTLNVDIDYYAVDASSETSSTGTITIQIADGNDAPTFAGTPTFDPTVDVVEGFLEVLSGSNPAEDQESPNQLSYSITGIDSDLFVVDSVNGEIEFKSAPDFEAPNDSNKDNDYVFNLIVADTGGETATASMKVTVTDDVQALTLNSVTMDLDEGEADVVTMSATAEDVSNSLTYSITGGADADLFEIDEETGKLTFISAPDADDPQDAGTNNVYDVTVLVKDDLDAASAWDTASVTITINDLHDEDPVFSSMAGASAVVTNSDEGELEITLAENTNSTGNASSTVSTFTFTNGEFSTSPGLGVTPDMEFTLTSDAATSNFEITTGTGASGVQTATLSLIAGADLNYEDESSIELTLAVTDEGGDVARTTISVVVEGVEEAPEYAAPPILSVRNDDSITFGDDIAASMVDPEGDELFYKLTIPGTGVLEDGNFTSSQYGTYSFLKGGQSGATWTISPAFGDEILTAVEMKTLQFHPATTYETFELEFSYEAGSSTSFTASTSTSGSVSLIVVDVLE